MHKLETKQNTHDGTGNHMMCKHRKTDNVKLSKLGYGTKTGYTVYSLAPKFPPIQYYDEGYCNGMAVACTP